MYNRTNEAPMISCNFHFHYF